MVAVKVLVTVAVAVTFSVTVSGLRSQCVKHNSQRVIVLLCASRRTNMTEYYTDSLCLSMSVSQCPSLSLSLSLSFSLSHLHELLVFLGRVEAREHAHLLVHLALVLGPSPIHRLLLLVVQQPALQNELLAALTLVELRVVDVDDLDLE